MLRALLVVGILFFILPTQPSGRRLYVSRLLPHDGPMKKGCDPADAKVACEGRRTAVARGEFFPDFMLDAWVFSWSELEKRTASFRAKALNMDERADEPYRYTCCPWCGNDLPSMEAVKAAKASDRSLDCGEEQDGC